MKTFAEKVIAFNRKLDFKEELPEGIRIMNPFIESKEAVTTSENFYRKFYNDHHKRIFIIGINPGRFGGAITGIPFTDPKRLISHCKIPFSGKSAHEPSSQFIYEMIEAFGGVVKFYQQFYINSVCPLGFTNRGLKGNENNYNYYDDPKLLKSVYEFMNTSFKQQLTFGIERNIALCLGAGKNEKFIRKMNVDFNFFSEIIPLEHPRYIMQYKSKEKNFYIQKYIAALHQAIALK